METKHTPGPWEHWIGGATWGITGPSGAASSCAEKAVRDSLILNDCTVIYIASKNNVAPALAFGDTKEEAEANAKLIAAAPDLLEALQILASIPIEDFGKESKPDYPLMAWNGTYLKVSDVLKARAAIKKATE